MDFSDGETNAQRAAYACKEKHPESPLAHLSRRLVEGMLSESTENLTTLWPAMEDYFGWNAFLINAIRLAFAVECGFF